MLRANVAPLPDGSGARDSFMNERYEALTNNQQQGLCTLAKERVSTWERSGSCRSEEDAMAASESGRPCHTLVIDGVFNSMECDQIVAALRAGVIERGGWDTDRHGKYPTIDVPLAVAGAEVEHLMRCRIFAHVLRPLASRFFGHLFLPEHLCFRDLFFVRYHATSDGASEATDQTELQAHTDGSSFSFNIALSVQGVDFEGGGTFFEHDGGLVQPARGGAVAHGGNVRHGGAPITRGERLLLVGFVGSEPASKSYSSKLGRWAAFNAFCKFGEAAWER